MGKQARKKALQIPPPLQGRKPLDVQVNVDPDTIIGKLTRRNEELSQAIERLGQMVHTLQEENARLKTGK